MISKQWYEILFENYAKTYDKESFTQGTIRYGIGRQSMKCW